MANLTKEELQALKECNLVAAMSNQEGWQTVFRPYLVDKLNQAFPDPSQFSKEEDFVYAAKVCSVFKKVVAEILGWVDQQIEMARKLEEKKKGVKDPFRIGE